MNNTLAKSILYPSVFLIAIIDYIVSFFTKVSNQRLGLPESDAVLSRPVDESDLSKGFRSTLVPELTTLEDVNHNLYTEFCQAASKYPDNNALGTRKKLKIIEEHQPDGKILKKFLQAPNYEWIKFKDVVKNVDNISNGLLAKGLKSNENIVINCETRPEWFMSALAAMKIKVPIVTLYATLGIEALEFGIKQTETKFLIISGEQLAKVGKILGKIKSVTNIIVICDEFHIEQYVKFKRTADLENIKVWTHEELCSLGEKSSVIEDYEHPKKDDLAIIMYTSGSTGNPKGAMITHGNLIVSSRTLRQRMEPFNTSKDVYIGYLPLAHVLELCTEFIMLNGGIPVGYSSPFTITDVSTGILKGEIGDLRVLNPSIMHSVPAVLERLSKAVKSKIKIKSPFFQTFFDIAFKQKLNMKQRNIDTKLLDWLLFNRISSAVIGENLNLLMCAGALLSEDVHDFVNIAMAVNVRQAYGLTETLACGTTQLLNQYKTGTVGSVVPSSEIRLVDWNEGDYRITDKPYPRGEVWIGGESICMGYYNMPEKTAEDFHVINGIRYFATGDVGEMNLTTGTLKLIDRKKDIVKLAGGEYVSLNKIECFLKLLPFVDNCCLIANPLKSYTVCLICPNQVRVIALLKEQVDSNNNPLSLDELDNLKIDKERNVFLIKLLEERKSVCDQLLSELTDLCLKKHCARFEIPTKIKFVPDVWLPDTGLVTDSFKLKRVQVSRFYQSTIEKFYS